MIDLLINWRSWDECVMSNLQDVQILATDKNKANVSIVALHDLNDKERKNYIEISIKNEFTEIAVRLDLQVAESLSEQLPQQILKLHKLQKNHHGLG